jgi:hypothetical protein
VAAVEDAERGRSAQCAAGIDVFDPAAAATRRDPKRRAVSICQRSRSKVRRRLGAPARHQSASPPPPVEERDGGERRGDQRERAGRPRSLGVSSGAALASVGGAASSLSLTQRLVA